MHYISTNHRKEETESNSLLFNGFVLCVPT